MNKYNATLIPDEQKTELSVNDMFDRIINLKLTCVDEQGFTESFVVRSDYELIMPNYGSDPTKPTVPLDGELSPKMQGKYIIRRCSQKPSIKVQYKMVTSNLGIAVDVFINNFFLLTKDGKHLRSFNSEKYKIESVEIAMGYWGQFRVRNRLDEVPTYDEFFKIKAPYGADKLTLTGAIVVTTDKLPPDSMLHIKGYVADVYSNPIDVAEKESASNAINGNPIATSKESLEDIMFKCVTRRYLNLHYFTDGKGSEIPDTKKNIAVSDFVNYKVPISYDKKTGMMFVPEAKQYGVKVYLSEEAKKVKLNPVIDSKGQEKPVSLVFENGWTVGQTIARIASYISGDLNFTYNLNGDVIVYTSLETNDIKKLHDTLEKDKMYDNSTFKKKYDNKLPAVYNINVDAVATINCPFFTFFEPFQYIEFSSRYALTSLVSYFASYDPTIYKFYMINASISFATVDEVNDVQITAIANKGAQ